MLHIDVKKTSRTNVKTLNGQLTIEEITFPKNTYLFLDKKNNIIFLFKQLPPYKNKWKYIYNVFAFDIDRQELDFIHIFRHKKIIAEIQTAFDEKVHKVVKPEYTDSDLVSMMKHDKKNKKQSGVRLTNNLDVNVKKKQITDEAYYANLFDIKSGNASMVANACRYHY